MVETNKSNKMNQTPLDDRIIVNTTIDCFCGYKATSYWDFFMHKVNIAKVHNPDVPVTYHSIGYESEVNVIPRHGRVKYETQAFINQGDVLQLMGFLVRE